MLYKIYKTTAAAKCGDNKLFSPLEAKTLLSTTRLERRKYMQLMMRKPNAAPA